MENIVLTSLVADALSLGSHWIYSQREIAEKFGGISGYSDPATSYHPGKHAGDFTHYGDQTMVLLRSLASHGRFDLTSFAAGWRAFWENPETLSYPKRFPPFATFCSDTRTTSLPLSLQMSRLAETTRRVACSLA